MDLRLPQWHSLKTRVTLFTLVIFVLSIWALSFFTSRLLQEDMERLLGEQQFSAVSVVAGQVGEEMGDRFDALGLVAKEVGVDLMGSAPALQVRLEQRPILQSLFNAGTFITGPDGTTIASVPVSVGRVGINYVERDSVATALKEGKRAIGKPVLGKQLHSPTFAMTVPIRNAQGKVIGALAGVIDLSKPNFLDKITQSNYGRTGGFLIIDPRYRLIITATDKKRIMEVLPTAGVNRYVDRNIAGYEGYSVLINALGEEQLASVKQIHDVGWYVLLGTPTPEAFAPIYNMQQRVLLVTLFLTLLAGGLTWWMLRRQLAPLLATASAMVALSNANRIPTPLPVTGQDEIGQLTGGFNRLIETWTQREDALKKSEQNLAITLNSIGDAVIATDQAGHISGMNPTAERLSGWSQADAMGRPLAEIFRIINAGTRETVPSPVQLVMAHGQVVALANHTVLLAKGGQEHHIADSAAPIRNATGHIVGVVLVFSDVTERRKAEAALLHEKAVLRSLIDATPDLIFIKDGNGVYLECNKASEQLIGLSRSEQIGKTDFDFFDHQTAEIIRGGDRDVITGGVAVLVEEWGTYPDGRRVLLETSKTPLYGAGGQIEGLVGISRDITERKAALKQIESLAFSDPLTGLPNRRLLLDRLEQALAAASRHGHQDALLFVDMDDFKTINDTLGHDKGDLLLKQISQRLIGCVREGDTVARLSGDEFVVLLQNLSSTTPEAAAQAQVVAQKILSALAQPYELDGHEQHSSASVGVTLFGGAQREMVEEPLKRAELAMYRAKTTARGTMRLFEPEMHTAVATRATLEADLRQALSEAQFFLYYQSQGGDGARLIGAEALVRWQHPQRGLVSPMEFIPVAEASGLILPLGQWVLRTACAQLALWASRAEMAPLSIAVNVSARQLRQPNFVDQVLSILQESGANPARLKLELTESVLVDNVEDTIVKMKTLRDSGVSFSLDDFGTGYSSLSYLKRLPLDQLKIDKSFVRDILTDANDAAIAKMVVALADSLGLQVIAEGVETEAQREFLNNLGCRNYQGYLFSRPLPIEEFEVFAAKV